MAVIFALIKQYVCKFMIANLKKKKKVIALVLIKGNLSNLDGSPTRATLNVRLQVKTILVVLRYYLEKLIVFMVRTGIHTVKVLLL